MHVNVESKCYGEDSVTIFTGAGLTLLPHFVWFLTIFIVQRQIDANIDISFSKSDFDSTISSNIGSRCIFCEMQLLLIVCSSFFCHSFVWIWILLLIRYESFAHVCLSQIAFLVNSFEEARIIFASFLLFSLSFALSHVLHLFQMKLHEMIAFVSSYDSLKHHKNTNKGHRSLHFGFYVSSSWTFILSFGFVCFFFFKVFISASFYFRIGWVIHHEHQDK